MIINIKYHKKRKDIKFQLNLNIIYGLKVKQKQNKTFSYELDKFEILAIIFFIFLKIVYLKK
jgi:hypothetical protein